MEVGMMDPSVQTSCPYIRENWFIQICLVQVVPQTGDAYGILVGSISRRSIRLSPILWPCALPFWNLYMALRQASECGALGFQGLFTRL
jgi:hypothetical protein